MKLLSLSLASVLTTLISLEFICFLLVNFFPNYHTEMWRYSRELKIRDPALGHRHLENKSVKLYGVQFSTDEKGHRKIPSKGEGNEVLFLGDSITVGWGVKANNTFHSKLSSLTDLSITNPSVGNYNIENITALYQGYIDSKPYGAVFYFHYINDIQANHYPHKFLAFFQRHSFSYGFLSSLYFRLGTSKSNSYVSFYKHHWENNGEERLLRGLSIIHTDLKKRGIPFYLVYIPEFHQFDNYPFESVRLSLKAFSHENGIFFIDTLPEFKLHSPDSVWVSKEDVHPNSKGHSLISKIVYNYLNEKN